MHPLESHYEPREQTAWRQFAARIGGTYERNFWGSMKVQAQYRKWLVRMDLHDRSKATWTRLKTLFLSRDNFRFTVSPRHVLSRVEGWLGMPQILSGHANFDGEFVCEGNYEHQLRALLEDPQLRFLLQSQPEVELAIEEGGGFFDRHPPGVSELCLYHRGVVQEDALLDLLYELFGHTLDGLVRIGSVAAQAPDVDF